MNDHWMVLYQIYNFHADRKSKMATTARHSLTQDPMGKTVENFFSEKKETIKPKLFMNDHWMVLYQVCNFHAGWKSKMAATAGQFNIGPCGKNSRKSSS